MEKITNRIYYQETRLPWRDKYLEELENKSEDELICDFGHGFTAYSTALNMFKEKREKRTSTTLKEFSILLFQSI